MQHQFRYRPGDKIGGCYQVYRALKGGMGEVYLCLDLETNLPFALKTFQQQYLTGPKLPAAFENEVATWIALEKHPNIVQCHFMQILDNQPFMILEWIASDESRGTDLHGWLRRGPLNLRMALDFAIDICRGLIHANEKQPGIVHRDLKPKNILIARAQLAKITDFGLARIVQKAELKTTADAESETNVPQNLLCRGDIVGTPYYMAPEQWLGGELDQRTDLYAIGCILYEMLTGHLLFQAASLNELRRQHLEAGIPQLTGGRALPRAVATVLIGCLAKRRGERFATVDHLLQQLTFVYQEQFAEMPRPITVSGEFTFADYTNRGATYTGLQRYNEALADFDRAIQLNPSDTKTYNNRGLTYAALEQYEKALIDYNQAIQLDPIYVIAYNNRGIIYVHLQQYVEALADFDRAIELDSDLAQAYANRGRTCAKLQRYDEALADLSQAIQLEPTDTTVYCSRGDIYRILQRYDEALADFERAIQLNPTDVKTYIDRGDTYYELQQYDRALADFSRVIELDPTYAPAYYNRGNTYSDLQRDDEALADYTRAVRLDPCFAQAYFNRGNTYLRLHDYDKALKDYSYSIQLDPTDAEAYLNRGATYRQLHDYESALSDYTRAIQLDPNFVQAYFNRGNTYDNLQRYEEALMDYTYAIQLDPDFVDAYFNIGVLLGKRGKWVEALPYFEEAAQLGDSESAALVAEIRRKLGMETAPQDDPALQALAALQQVGSVEVMHQTVARFPFLAQADFIAAIEQAIAQQVPPEHRPAFEQRLVWLRRIAKGQNE